MQASNALKVNRGCNVCSALIKVGTSYTILMSSDQTYCNTQDFKCWQFQTFSFSPQQMVAVVSVVHSPLRMRF